MWRSVWSKEAFRDRVTSPADVIKADIPNRPFESGVDLSERGRLKTGTDSSQTFGTSASRRDKSFADARSQKRTH